MADERIARRWFRGMTLVELLMVVAIMTILLAVAVPMLRPTFRDRQLREASRQVNSYLAGAKARAVEAGRPVGVWIERQRNVDGQIYATQLYMAEVSPSYTGAVLGARALVEFPPTATFTPPTQDPNWPYDVDFTIYGRLVFVSPPELNSVADVTSTELLAALVGELEVFYIQFVHKGPTYSCVRSGTNFFVSIPGGVPPGCAANPGLTYEISRGPSKSIVNPLTLPGETVLDMAVSGVGLGQYAAAFGYSATVPPVPPGPVLILFSPSGQLSQVYVENIAKTPTGPLYLLVGRRSKLASATTPYTEQASNLADPANLWVTVNNRTGAITTDDNSVSVPTMTPLERLIAAREFARGSRQKGGR
jgi:prepilin-type N-terminal cleavage/methylation domain-containing protein